jgi:uncharacterized protein YecA (UPF0149 family)
MALEMIMGDKQTGQTTNIEAGTMINNLVVQEAAPVPGQPGQPQAAPSPGATKPAYGKKIGRNERCPCKSGRKFKWCHGENGEMRYYGP